MRIASLLLTLLIFALPAGAQTASDSTGTSASAPPEPSLHIGWAHLPDTSAATVEKLVRVALTRPSYDQAYRGVRLAEHQLSKARNEWLNLLTVTLNYNQFDFQQPTGTASNYAYVFPKYFFGLTIPLGFFISRSADIRIAKEERTIAQDEQAEAARTIRATVVGQYRAYFVYQEEIAVAENVLRDESAVFREAEKSFRDGKTTLENYDAASKIYNNEILRKLNIQINSDAAKTSLEQALGMTLEQALSTPDNLPAVPSGRP